MRFLTGIALLVLTLSSSIAIAQDPTQGANSARSMLPRCTAVLAPNAQDTTAGRCAGIVATLAFVSRVLPDNLKFCHPNTTTPEQMLQVIVSFVESNADSAAQDFRLIALAALRDKWPCQE